MLLVFLFLAYVFTTTVSLNHVNCERLISGRELTNGTLWENGIRNGAVVIMSIVN